MGWRRSFPSRWARTRSEEHTSELHHEWISYAVFCLKKKIEPCAPPLFAVTELAFAPPEFLVGVEPVHELQPDRAENTRNHNVQRCARPYQHQCPIQDQY